MAFTLLVCSDLHNKKVNLEIPLDNPPNSLGSLHGMIEAAFAYEERNMRGSSDRSAPVGFALTRVQIYDDAARQWVDLVSASQLHPYDQLYVYQRFSTVDPDSELPPPLPAAYFDQGSDRGSSPARTQQTSTVDAADLAESVRMYPTSSNSGAVPSSSNGAGSITVTSQPIEAAQLPTDGKMRFVFAEADRNDQGYLRLEEFRELFNKTHVQFNLATIDDIFQRNVSNPEYMGFNDFIQFARGYPVTANALYSRLVDRAKVVKIERALDNSFKQAEQLRKRREQLQAELDAVSRQLLDEETTTRELEGDLSQMSKHRGTVEEQEQVVLDKEARVAYQREILRREEAEFVKTARQFDMRAGGVDTSSSTPGLNQDSSSYTPGYRR